jgi:Leucine rich repeat
MHTATSNLALLAAPLACPRWCCAAPIQIPSLLRPLLGAKAISGCLRNQRAPVPRFRRVAQRLVLSSNQLLGLPTVLPLLTSLRSLDLSCNSLAEADFTAACAGLRALTYLDLSSNQLQGIPPVVAALSTLRCVHQRAAPPLHRAVEGRTKGRGPQACACPLRACRCASACGSGLRGFATQEPTRLRKEAQSESATVAGLIPESTPFRMAGEWRRAARRNAGALRIGGDA